MRSFFVLPIVFLLSGCATQQWASTTKAQDSLYQDKMDCESQSNQAAWDRYPQQQQETTSISVYQPDKPLDPYISDRELYRKKTFNACMNGKGWYLESQGR